VTKSWPKSQLSRHELFLVVAVSANAVDNFDGDRLEVTSHVKRFFHLFTRQRNVARYSLYRLPHIWARVGIAGGYPPSPVHVYACSFLSENRF